MTGKNPIFGLAGDTFGKKRRGILRMLLDWKTLRGEHGQSPNIN
jgi:hypothetical protein